MAKGRGYRCPSCDTLTIHLDKESESFSKCSNCGFVGWRIIDPVKPGKGKGNKCVNCRKSTLHYLTTLEGVDMFRCSVCLYAGIGVMQSGAQGETS